MVVRDHPALSLSRQCRLLSIGRSSLYYEPKGESAETLALMRRIDALFLKYPYLRRPPDGSPSSPRRGADRASPGGSTDAPARPSGGLSGAADQRSASRAPGVALSAQGLADRAAGPRLVRRHHLYPGAARLPLPGGDHGLGEPPRPGLAAVEHAGRGLLHGRAGGGPGALRHAGDLQHRPGQPVHQHGLHRPPAGGRRAHLDGWQRPVHGQRSAAHSDRWRSRPQSSSGCGARSNTRRSTCTRSPTASPPGA